MVRDSNGQVLDVRLQLLHVRAVLRLEDRFDRGRRAGFGHGLFERRPQEAPEQNDQNDRAQEDRSGEQEAPATGREARPETSKHVLIEQLR